MNEMKNILKVINSIVSTAEKMIYKLGDTAINTIQSETHIHTRARAHTHIQRGSWRVNV